MQKLSAIIRSARSVKRIGQAKICKDLKIGIATYSKIENDDLFQETSIYTIAAIVQYLKEKGCLIELDITQIELPPE